VHTSGPLRAGRVAAAIALADRVEGGLIAELGGLSEFLRGQRTSGVNEFLRPPEGLRKVGPSTVGRLELAMLMLAMVALGLVTFAAMWAFVSFCDRV